MKFIGQHIYQLIARFRSDVYLEDIDTGTIVSGGNLGLDSNNKIVKNTVSGGGDFTLTADSGSNQTISTGNTMDIAGGNAISTVVSATDTVTINHDDTSSQASVINGVTSRGFISSIGLDTYGHVTSIGTRDDRALTYVDSITFTSDEDSTTQFIASPGSLDIRIDSDGESTSVLRVQSGTSTVATFDESGNLSLTGRILQKSGNTVPNKGGAGDVLVNDGGEPKVRTRSEFIGDLSGQAASDFDLNSNKLTNVAAPTNDADAANKSYVDGRKITDFTAPTSDVSVNSQKITNVATPAASTDAATKGYVDGREVTNLTAPTSSFSMNSQKITSLATPTASTDAATKSYADRPNKLIQVYSINFKDDIGTDEHFLPFNSTAERTSSTHEDVAVLMPYAGKLKEIHYRNNFNASSATATWKIVKCPKDLVVNTTNTTTLDTQTTAGPTNTASGANNVRKITFDSDAAFAQHDLIAISMQHDSDVTSGNKTFWVTAIFEFDVSTVSE